jgi:murein DD-endopeptidase MepM/ murein hydrolase activator NlpD
LPNAWDGVVRLSAHFRPAKPDRSATAIRPHRQVVRVARRVVDLATGHPTTQPASRGLAVARHEPHRPTRLGRRRSLLRRTLVLRLTSERTVPLAVALIVVLAGVVSLGPGAVQPVGAAQGQPQNVRLAIGGGVAGPVDPALLSDLALGANPEPTAEVDDGTLYKPVAVDTSVESSSDLLHHYTVKSGDTLKQIAAKYDVSVMTIVWANHLKSTDQLHSGQDLTIPPVTGLILTVAASDTLASLAAKYKITTDAIVTANELTDENLIIGQVLLMPGAKGAAIPKPKVTVSKPRSSGSGGGSPYVGGSWAWPVTPFQFVSQYYSSYHPAIDIAAVYGTPVRAARPGKVIFAGWYQGGEGYTVWIDLGNGMFTCEEHLSKILVSVGDYVSKGEVVGRIGMTGNATGPHVHFEIWVGHPWMSGSYRVNPMRYY